MSANSFIVRRGTAADVEDILRIEHAALRGHSRLFPGMVSDPAGFMLYEVEKNRKSSSDPNSTIQWLVAQDPANREIAAILKCEAVGDMSATPHQTITDAGPYANAGTAAFYDSNTLARREYMGSRPHFYVHIFATDPQHQRRGAGRALLTQLATQADAENKPVYLESSPSAVTVYKKLGFVETGVKFRFPDGDEIEPLEVILTVVAREPIVVGST